MSDLRILLVEDSLADAELAKLRLRGVGEVEHCTSLSAALARLADANRAAPSVVLLDLSLPDSRGLATLDRMLAAQPPPVLVMSGEDDPAAARAALERGARAFVKKGDPRSPLAQLVREAARGSAGPRWVARVLLVEDSHGDAVLAQRALAASDARFELTIARTLGEGVARLAEGFDAILLDLTLPDCVGPETVTRMRAAARELPIVVLSGADDAEVADRCLRAGASAYRQKGSIDPNELQSVVARAIERGR